VKQDTLKVFKESAWRDAEALSFDLILRPFPAKMMTHQDGVIFA